MGGFEERQARSRAGELLRPIPGTHTTTKHSPTTHQTPNNTTKKRPTEAGLGHLCEFIEDCEFSYLSVQVLHVLGREGPAAKDPAR